MTDKNKEIKQYLQRNDRTAGLSSHVINTIQHCASIGLLQHIVPSPLCVLAEVACKQLEESSQKHCHNDTIKKG